MYSNNYPWESKPYNEPTQQSRITAAYRADALADGVIAPILKSFFLGFSLGVLAGLLVWQFHWPDGLHPLMAWLIVWFAIMPLTFWTFTRRGQWLIERISGADLNGDGYIGQPIMQQLAPPEPVRVIVEQEQGRHVDYIDLPEKVTHEQMATFARAVLSGRDLAEGVWGGALVVSGVCQPIASSEILWYNVSF